MKSMSVRLMKGSVAFGGMVVDVETAAFTGGRAFLRGLGVVVFHGLDGSGLRSLDLAVPYFSRRDGHRRASAAWLTSSKPALMQLEHLRLWRQDMPSFIVVSPPSSMLWQVGHFGSM